MTRALTIVMLGALASFACGAGPTSPTAVTTGSQQPTGAPPSPVPPPNPPAPAPTPPAPTPNPPTPPAPPEPAPDIWEGSATITTSQWMTATPPIPESFKVRLTRESLAFGPLTSPVLIWEQKGDTIGAFARPDGMNLQILFNVNDGKGSWTLTGIPGEAAGALTVAR